MMKIHAKSIIIVVDEICILNSFEKIKNNFKFFIYFFKKLNLREKNESQFC